MCKRERQGISRKSPTYNPKPNLFSFRTKKKKNGNLARRKG